MSNSSEDMARLFPSLFNAFTVLDSETEQCVKHLGSRAGTGLSRLVSDLGPILTHKDPSKRQSGLEFLGKVIDRLPLGFLGEDECHFFVQFFVDRTKDSTLMHPSIVTGFGALVLRQGQVLSDEDLVVVLRKITGELQVQSLTVNDRSRVFEIFAWCLGRKMHVLQRSDFSSQFVLGFMQAAEGETNPRNLHVIFSCWPIVIQSLDSDIFIDDIFEILSCYFPIDFTPPKGAGYRVTKEDLSTGLHNCLAASAKFAQAAIPLFLEKLGSDLVESKVDALVCFEQCLQSYSPAQLKDHLKDIWSHCKQEIMGISANSNAEVATKACSLLRAISQKLCQVVQSAENSSLVSSWIEIVWGELKPFLKFVESNLMETAVGIFCHLCASDELMSEPLINRSIPILMDVEKGSDDRSRILELICKLLEACHPLRTSPEWASRLLTLCETGSVSGDKAWSCAGLMGLRLASTKLAYPMVDDVLLECFRRAKAKEQCLDAASMKALALSVASCNIEEVDSWCESVAVVPSNAEDVAIVAAICVGHHDILRKKVPEFVRGMDTADQNLRKTLILALKEIFASICSEELLVDLLVLELDLLSKLTNLVEVGDGNLILSRNSLISDITSCLGDEKYGNLLDSFGKVFLNETRNNSLTALLCAIHPKLISNMQFRDALFATDLEQTEELMVVRGSFLNKVYPLTPSMSGFLSSISSPQEQQQHLAFVIKGLVMRGSKEAGPLIARMLQQLRGNLKSDDHVRGFLSLLESSNTDYYTAANHHRVLPFYKQKVFSLTFPILMEWFNDGEEGVLDVLLQQLPCLPKTLVESELMPILPRITRALFSSSRKSATKLSPAVTSFLGFIKDVDPAVLEDLADVIIPFLLETAEGHEAKAMEDRITALTVLESLASEKCPKEVRKMVAGKTAALLNDKKRIVRRAAVEARNAWLLMS